MPSTILSDNGVSSGSAGLKTTAASDGSLALQTTTSGGTATTAVRIDTSQNVGIGVTPSAWNTSRKVLQGTGAALMLTSGNNSHATLFANTYENTSGVYTYQNTAAASYYQQYNGAHSWYYAASGTAGNAITFTQAMTLDASGNLGVGTSSPFYRLSVRQPTLTATVAEFRTIDGTNNPGLEIKTSTAGTTLAQVYSSGATANLMFETNSAERARIDSSGNLLVGKTAVNNTNTGFSVDANFGSGGTGVKVVNSASTSAADGFQMYSTGAGAYRFYINFAGTIFATSTTISAISDIRFKENVRDLDAGLAEVMALKPRLYDWKEGKGADVKNARGFIAQEFEEVFPDLIDEWKDEAPEGEEPYKSVRQDLIPVLVKAIQEQQAIIEQLKARLDAANL